MAATSDPDPDPEPEPPGLGMAHLTVVPANADEVRADRED